MYRHPFANPEHAYGRVRSIDYDRRVVSQSPGLYRSFVSMASSSTIFDDRRHSPSPHRDASSIRRVRLDRGPGGGENEEQPPVLPAWRRALNRMRRRAKRSFQKVRALLQADRRR